MMDGEKLIDLTLAGIPWRLDPRIPGSSSGLPEPGVIDEAPPPGQFRTEATGTRVRDGRFCCVPVRHKLLRPYTEQWAVL